MNISSWTVRARLTLGFGVVCALMLVILGVGLVSVWRVDSVMNTIVNESVPKIDAAYTIEMQADLQSIAVRDMLLTTEVADRQKQTELLAQSRATFIKNFELLERMIVLPKGKALLAKVKDVRIKYIEAQNALVAHLTADDGCFVHDSQGVQRTPHLRQSL